MFLQSADIYLLDDPLSAVDANVGKHIFDQCIKNYLGNKTVVLVTHQLQYLKDANKILVIDKGSLSDSGNYNTLIHPQKAAFYTSFLKKTETEEDNSGLESNPTCSGDIESDGERQRKVTFAHIGN